MLVKPLEVGKKIDMSDFDPNSSKGFDGGKGEALEELAKLNARLEVLQEELYAEGKHPVLVILQGMDTSGKDGVIRAVFEGVNPTGVRVASFKVPTAEELAHDYLWRIHKETPRRGEIVIFNRSQYEDVLVVRVHQLVDEKIWKKRYDQINCFERALAEEGTIIRKYFLHIDQDEQKERLLSRLDEKDKRWKFSPGDLDERARWREYRDAYEDMLNKTNTEWAPWTVVPANRKWYRNLVICQSLVDTLESLHIKVPLKMTDEDAAKYRNQLLSEDLTRKP